MLFKMSTPKAKEFTKEDKARYHATLTFFLGILPHEDREHYVAGLNNLTDDFTKSVSAALVEANRRSDAEVHFICKNRSQLVYASVIMLATLEYSDLLDSSFTFKQIELTNGTCIMLKEE